MCRKVITEKARAKETDFNAAGSDTPKPPSSGSIRRPMTGSPIQPSPRLVNVMPSWVEESTASKWVVANSAIRTRQPPVFAIGRSWLARIFTSANSAATKKPLAATRPRTSRISKDARSVSTISRTRV